MFRDKTLKKCSAVGERREGSSTVGGEVTTAYVLNEALYCFNIFLLPWLNSPQWGQGLLIIEDS